MSNEGKILIGIGVLTLVIVIGAALLFGGKSSTQTPSAKLTADQSKLLVRSDSYVKKTTESKVVLVEFGDFQCPACAAVYPVITQILNDSEGKVSFVFRQFPLPMHKNARLAAQAAEAAGVQGKFFEMYDNLYQNQKEWGESNEALTHIEKYAKNIGLDMEKFLSDVKANKYDARIQNDINDGNALGVNATPTFYLNGEKLESGFSYDELKKKIEDSINSSK